MRSKSGKSHIVARIEAEIAGLLLYEISNQAQNINCSNECICTLAH